MNKRIGKRTLLLPSAPAILGHAAVAGQKEGEGPLKDCFDSVSEDSSFGEQTWEKAESRMLRDCFALACDRAALPPSSLDAVLSGDLLNQCVSSSFAMKDSGLPYLGLYGACSTMAEGLGLAALLIDGGYASTAAAVTGSHFCSAERQYRFPLEYGGVHAPTAQWTVTGAGAVVLSRKGNGRIAHGKGRADALVEQVAGEDIVEPRGRQLRLVAGERKADAQHAAFRLFPAQLTEIGVLRDLIKAVFQRPLPFFFPADGGPAPQRRRFRERDRLFSQAFSHEKHLTSFGYE